MLEILNLKPEAFGLDISDLSLKLVQLKRKGKFFSLVTFGEEPIPSGLIKRGEIKDEKALAEIIKKSLAKAKKIKTKHVVTSLPEEKAFSQVIQMPMMPEEDLKSAVIYQAENYVPMPIQEVYLDLQILPLISEHEGAKSKKIPDHYDVLIAALPEKVINAYLSSLKLAGLQPIAFEIESMAVSRALIKNETSPFPVLIIDLGATRTSFIIFAGQAIRFTTSLPISSQGFTEILSKTLKISLAKAEELKMRYGLEEKIKIKMREEKMEKWIERGRVFEALVPALVDLVQQIKKCLDYYETHPFVPDLPPDRKKIQKILLCGGGANLKGLIELLTIELKLPVELGNPFINILKDPKKEIPQFPLEQSLGYTTALGLALRGQKYD